MESGTLCLSRMSVFLLHSLLFGSDGGAHLWVYRLGTSAKRAGSTENFTKIDKEYACSYIMAVFLFHWGH
jgi:hypothetical protein